MNKKMLKKKSYSSNHTQREYLTFSQSQVNQATTEAAWTDQSVLPACCKNSRQVYTSRQKHSTLSALVSALPAHPSIVMHTVKSLIGSLAIMAGRVLPSTADKSGREGGQIFKHLRNRVAVRGEHKNERSWDETKTTWQLQAGCSRKEHLVRLVCLWIW